MNKKTRNIIAIVVIILLTFGIIFAVYNHFKSEPVDTKPSNESILDDANTGLENILNNILDDGNTENNEEENTETNTETNTESSNKGQSTSKNDDPIDVQTTSGEKKAIQLAKEEWKKTWGDTDDVSFNNVMVQGDGKYVISVNNSSTTAVIQFYIVDVVTGLVEER